MKTSSSWIGLFGALVIWSGCNMGGEANKVTKESAKPATDSKAAPALAAGEKKAEKAEEKTKPEAEAPKKAGGIGVDSDKPPTVAIEELVTKDEDGGKVTTGKIVNKGTVACRSPKAALSYMMAGGKVWEAKSEEPDEMFQKMLEPGKSVAFTLKNADAGKDVLEVKAWGDCSEPL